MRLITSVSLVCLCLLASACTQGSNDAPGTAGPPAAMPSPPAGHDAQFPSAPGAAQSEELSPVPIESGAVTLTPENTQIQFIGTHTGDRPDPRVGVFTQFNGRAEVDPDSRTLRSIAVDIQTESLETPIGNLTNHLRSPDFFDSREHPTARFESTKIAPADGSTNERIVTGNLTMLGTTKEISFPATVAITDEGLTLQGSLTIDRTEFGMDRLQDRVTKEAEINVAIGRKTRTPQSGGGFGGPGPGGPGGAGFDPAALFKQSDADGDGKLTGDEIPDRMRQNLEAIDADGDGAVTLEELQERMRQFGGRGGPGGGDRRGGGAKEESAPQGSDT